MLPLCGAVLSGPELSKPGSRIALHHHVIHYHIPFLSCSSYSYLHYHLLKLNKTVHLLKHAELKGTYMDFSGEIIRFSKGCTKIKNHCTKWSTLIVGWVFLFFFFFDRKSGKQNKRQFSQNMVNYYST